MCSRWSGVVGGVEGREYWVCMTVKIRMALNSGGCSKLLSWPTGGQGRNFGGELWDFLWRYYNCIIFNRAKHRRRERAGSLGPYLCNRPTCRSAPVFVMSLVAPIFPMFYDVSFSNGCSANQSFQATAQTFPVNAFEFFCFFIFKQLHRGIYTISSSFSALSICGLNTNTCLLYLLWGQKKGGGGVFISFLTFSGCL